MNSTPRIALLGSSGKTADWAAQLAAHFDVVLDAEDPAVIVHAAEARQCQEVALCNPDAGLAEQLKLADRLLEQGIGVWLLRPSVPHGMEGLGLVRRRLGGQPLVHLPARTIGPRLAAPKRVFDVLFSTAVLLLGAPLWCLIALVVKLRDGGPVFFVQDRVGPDGRHFAFIKFRTMWPDADQHREWYENRHGRQGHVFKLEHDPRRTPVGRVLRRFSLDEIPQFLHALAGWMSVVGPRPPLPSEVARYEPWQRRRLAGWFGLTGLWQVCGRSEVRDLDDIVLLDALYLHNHSCLLDVRIILRTIRLMLSRHGAY